VNVHTISARAAAALVALIAGAASWEHITSVAVGAGERPWVAASLPAAIDGLIVVGVAALLEDKRAGRVGRLSARLAIVTGVVATLAANIASAEPTWTARLVAVAAPVSFLISVEVLTRTGRTRPNPDNIRVNGQAPDQRKPLRANLSQDPARGGVPATTKPRRKSTSAKVAAAAVRQPSATNAMLASRLGISERTVQRYRPPAPAEAASPNGAVK
jgi:hypothetical protein